MYSLFFLIISFFFFFNDTATTEIYTLSLHDALPISPSASLETSARAKSSCSVRAKRASARKGRWSRDRKSTRLNSSHVESSYAVFCLKKKTPTSFHAAHVTELFPAWST